MAKFLQQNILLTFIGLVKTYAFGHETYLLIFIYWKLQLGASELHA